MTKKILKIFFAGFILITAATGNKISAETRDYFYKSFYSEIRINKDTTFDVSEKIKLNFTGEYNQAWRQIPVRKFDAITDISVVDSETGKPLDFHSKKLDKTKPESWGKYTWDRKDGNYNIEWYYDLADTSHEWIVKYRVHGGLGFYKNHDELYWNLFSNFERQINEVRATVYLPAEADKSALNINLYKPDVANGYFLNSSYKIENGRTFEYSILNVPIGSPLTIYAEWPKGIVSEKAYWIDFVKIYWGYIFSVLLIIASIIPSVVHHKKFEHRGRGVIIPEYEPPQNIPPAMAEMVARESITPKAWPATIIDLAIRGYVEIVEDVDSKMEKITAAAKRIILAVLSVILLAVILLPELLSLIDGVNTSLAEKKTGKTLLLLAPVLLFAVFKLFRFKSRPKIEYRVNKKKEFEDDVDLHDYEKRFLTAIFREKDYFSTKENKKLSNADKTRKISLEISEIDKWLYEETDQDAKVYEKPLAVKKWQAIPIIVIIGAVILAAQRTLPLGQIYIAALGSSIAVSIWFLWVKLNPYPTKEGAIIREKWLGFKLYLKTAEKYRLQNLKPEYFEKYLPYAMIFGVEKKWAKAFESVNMPAPGWYGGTAYMAGVSGPARLSGFSPSGFSQSLSSSFSSAFSTASGSSGAGGGGSAGGGGGGGGGGAS